MIEWGGQTFYIEDKRTLKVILFEEGAGWCDQLSWEEAMMDGPIADLYQARELVGRQDFIRVPIDTRSAIERMIAVSRGLFIQPLEELSAYAGAKAYPPTSQYPTLC